MARVLFWRLIVLSGGNHWTMLQTDVPVYYYMARVLFWGLVVLSGGSLMLRWEIDVPVYYLMVDCLIV